MKNKILAAAFATALPALLISNSASALALADTDGYVPNLPTTNYIKREFTYIVSDDVVLNYFNSVRSVSVDAVHPSGTLSTGPGSRNGVQAFGGTSDGGTISACATALRESTAATSTTVDGTIVTTPAVVGGCQEP